MFKMVQEGKLDIFVKCNSAQVAGTLVKLDTANPGYVIPVAAGEKPHGVLAQDVVDPTVNNFKLDSVTHVAYIGGKVGVYFDGGQYYTDNIVSGNTVSYGTQLYSGAGGKFTTTASGNAVAVVEGPVTNLSAATGTKVLVRLLPQ